MTSITKNQNNTIDGNGTLREDLDIIRMSDNCWIIVHKQTETILCQSWRYFQWMLSEPIKFKTANNAQKWITEGCIADIQESLTNLNIGFVNEQIRRAKQY